MEWLVTDNIHAETWRRLLEFANVDFCTEQIIRVHGLPKTKAATQNYKKQASQARACVMQAKEYFEATRASSLYTSPNHLYYGNVALSCLMMLVNGDGNSSLDRLRLDTKNNHHGLDFTIGSTSADAEIGTNLLDKCRSEVLKFGHFSNWYNTLSREIFVYADVRRASADSYNVQRSIVGKCEALDHSSLAGNKQTLFDLLSFLPDLQHDLNRLQLPQPTARGSYRIEATQKNSTLHYTWVIHSCSSVANKERILEKFTVESRYADKYVVTDTINESGAIVKLNYSYEKENDIRFFFPDMRETINHDLILYADDIKTQEIVDLYLISYQLSMLARYYPDIWVRCLESQCKAAKLIEHAVNLIQKKFPILALSVLSGNEVVITTHRRARG